MKKSLFVLGVAVAAFASCTNEEVMEVASNRAIGFSVFVGNNTKAAVTEVSNETLNNFYVFGASKAAADANWAPSFNNDNVTANSGSFGSNATWTTPEVTAYWQVGEDHVFAAYADGNNGSLTTGTSDNNVSFDAESQKLTFTGYSASNSKDLIVAIPAKIEGSNVIAGYNTGVGLSFYHALSQVKFTFTTTDAEAYTLKISDLKIGNAVTKATGTVSYNTNALAYDWTSNTTKGEYSFDEIGDVASEGNHSSSCIVIPQSNTNDLNVTFTATISDTNGEIKSGKFTAALSYTTTSTGENSLKENTSENTWTPGFIYNYTAEINGGMIKDDDDDDDDKLQPITFTVTSVDKWTDASNVTIEPTATQGN